MNWKITINVILSAIVVVAGFASVYSDDSAVLEFRTCLKAANYDDDLTTLQFGKCLEFITKDEWPKICKKLSDMSLNSGPECWKIATKDIPAKCVNTPSGKQQMTKMYNNLLIMQLEHCTQTQNSDNKRMIKIMLQQHGYPYPLVQP